MLHLDHFVVGYFLISEMHSKRILAPRATMRRPASLNGQPASVHSRLTNISSSSILSGQAVSQLDRKVLRFVPHWQSEEKNDRA
jgi:hypothetical protein